jgi:DNA-binding HxlR family transcriptional regulator
MIDFSQLDRVIHEKGRLAIMTLLASRAEWSFQDLKTELAMSDGNLITHLRTLHKAGYISSARTPDAGSRPQTLYALTTAGKTAFTTYVDLLEEIVRTARPA